jgi:response regulator NasT
MHSLINDNKLRVASFLQSHIVKESAYTIMANSNHLKIVVINSAAPVGAGRAAHRQAERARVLRIGLLDTRYNIIAALPPDTDLAAQIGQLRPDMIIIDGRSDAVLKKVIAATADAKRPIVCFAEEDNWDSMHTAIEAGVSAYVVAGLSADRIKTVLDVAMARFGRFRFLSDMFNPIISQLMKSYCCPTAS